MAEQRRFEIRNLPGQFHFWYQRHDDIGFPIGRVGDPQTPGQQAMDAVVKTYGNDYRVLYMALQPHDRDKPDGVGHDQVKAISELPDQHTRYVCDGIIVTDFSRPWLIAVAVADCPVTAVIDDVSVCAAGSFHGGWPEVAMESPNIVHRFFGKWPTNHSNALAAIGPGIAGTFFERETGIPERYNGTPSVVETAWGTKGFSLHKAIIYDLECLGVNSTQIIDDSVDTYAATANLHYDWASSDQLAKWMREYLSIKELYAPRMAAILTFSP